MILIVEDDAHIRRLFSLNLRTRGYEVVDTASGLEALELIRERLPSLMLLDIRLPDIYGWEVLRHLEASQMPHFPVIVVTASIIPTEERREEFPQIVDILFKPIPIETLIEKVKQTLGEDSKST